MEEIMMIPDADPLPLPAPVPLLKFLLLLTMTLHLVAMNFIVGGGVAALWAFLKAKGEGGDNLFFHTLSQRLVRMLPIGISFTVSLGVAPLLFVQVMYGQFFYTATILVAWAWLAVVGLLIVSYFCSYTVALKYEDIGSRGPFLIALSVVIFFLVGFIMSDHSLLALNPQKWGGEYGDIHYGLNLFFREMSLFPRYLHFMVGALAVGGMYIVVDGFYRHRKGDESYGTRAMQFGSMWLVIPTLSQFLFGPLFLFTLPSEVRGLFLGGSLLATGLLGTGIALGLVGAILLLMGSISPKPAPVALTGSVFIVLTVAIMVIVRQLVREAYLKPHFQLSALTVVPQWTVLLAFAIILVVGLAIIGYMIKENFASLAKE